MKTSILAVVLVLAVGCGSERVVRRPETISQAESGGAFLPGITGGDAPLGAPKAPSEKALPEVPEFIYFDYDHSNIRDAELPTLDAWVALVDRFGPSSVILVGHCDERGTTDYNLALGLRRAQSVRDALARLGVPLSRMECQTAGEEFPADLGHDEAAWARNRRCVYILRSGE